MKCEFCGAELQIDDELCPHCKHPNPHYIRHREDMKAYGTAYRKTEKEVLENTARLSRKTVRAVILAVLVALCAVAAVFCAKSDDIRYARQERQIARGKAGYEAKIREYMEADDPAGLYRYASRNRLTWTDAMAEYDKVFSAAMNYALFYERAMEMIGEGEKRPYMTIEERCEEMSRYIDSLYELRERGSYAKEEWYTDGKEEFMKKTEEKAELILRGYFGVTEEDVKDLPELSRARLAILLEDGYRAYRSERGQGE